MKIKLVLSLLLGLMVITTNGFASDFNRHSNFDGFYGQLSVGPAEASSSMRQDDLKPYKSMLRSRQTKSSGLLTVVASVGYYFKVFEAFKIGVGLEYSRMPLIHEG